MPKVTISNSKGLVEERGGGLTVESTSALVGATTVTGALVQGRKTPDDTLSAAGQGQFRPGYQKHGSGDQRQSERVFA